MSADSPQRPGQARGLVASNARVVNAENFSDGQKRAIGRYVELSKTAGVLVGAHAGLAVWDLRPLILDAGKLLMLRFSDPGMALDKGRFNWLKLALSKRLAWGPRPEALLMGEEAGQIW